MVIGSTNNSDLVAAESAPSPSSQDSLPTAPAHVSTKAPQAQYDVLKHMKKIPALISMFDYLCTSKPARSLFE